MNALRSASMERCARCGALADTAVTTFDRDRPQTTAYCDVCWRLVRTSLGHELLEGPLVWGADWQEVAAWMERALSAQVSQRIRRLVAHEIRRQQPHLSSPPPARIAALLTETDQPGP